MLFFNRVCLFRGLPSLTPKIKAMPGMLGGGENICGWLFMMELLPLGYHCTKKRRSYLSQTQDAAYSWNTDRRTTENTKPDLFRTARACDGIIIFLNKNAFLARHTHCLVCDCNQFTNRLCGVELSENKTGRNFIEF